MDTVEQNVEGLAQQVIAEDEEKRAEELVCGIQAQLRTSTNFMAECIQYRPKTSQLGLKTGNR